MMKDAGGLWANVHTSWLSSISQCCAPLALFDDRQRRSKSLFTSPSDISWPLGRTSDQHLLITSDNEKWAPSISTYDQTVDQQPVPEPRPRATTAQRNVGSSAGRSGKERAPRKSLASARTSFSVRRRFKSDASSRRPLISAPSDFRHLHTGSYDFPPASPRAPPVPPTARQVVRRRNGQQSPFRPLELSIYMDDNQLSPMLPHFDMGDLVSPPPPAYMPRRSEESHTLAHQRSYSSMTFHVPRRAVAEQSLPMRSEEMPPRIPPKAASRPRAYTSGDVEMLKERVAHAMVEVEKLQRRIDDVVERQSIYVNSRPSTAHSIAHTMPEPMPAIPALPPAAPSFAQRLNSEIDRPQTAPIRAPIRTPNPQMTLNEAPSMSRQGLPQTLVDQPPPPPLPLVLRPPLRKKKSFSRVSTWLFPANGQHSRDLSLESITNVPRPIRGNGGFYQCFGPSTTNAAGPSRGSVDSFATVSDWESDEDRTVPTTWSPQSTPVAKLEEPTMERTTTFGKSDSRGRTHVGMAF